MAQYLLNVLSDSTELASDEEDAAIDVFNDGLRANGQWVFAGGMSSPSSATVVDSRDRDEPIITDGPFLESKEHVAGFWIIEAPHLDAALRLAAAGSRACHRRVEVRAFL